MKFAQYFLPLTLMLCVNSLYAGDPTPPQYFETAAEAFESLVESGQNLKARPLAVKNSSSGLVSYGGEKEGSSSLMTRIMGPTPDVLLSYVNGLPKLERKKFLKRFLSEFVSGKIRQAGVVDVEGRNVEIDLTEIRGDFKKMKLAQLTERFEYFLILSEGRPFSFISSAAKRKIFLGKYAGQTTATAFKSIRYSGSKWVANFGESQKYVDAVHGTGVGGWEFTFKPMNSFAEFEVFIAWFKSKLATKYRLFEAPGHQRVVMPVAHSKNSEITRKLRKRWLSYMAETLRMVQAYIVVRGIKGSTGIEYANYKSVHSDSTLESVATNESGTGRGVLRVDSFGRWYTDSFGIELRSGTKDAEVQRFVEQVLSARGATADFSGLSTISDYSFIEDVPRTIEEFGKKFGVNREVAKAFLDNVKNARGGPKGKGISSMRYLLPLWSWENAPFGTSKASTFQSARAEFIRSVARTSSPSVQDIRSHMKGFIRRTNVEVDLVGYMTPAKGLGSKVNSLARVVYPLDKPRSKNPNLVDLGIEFSGRFPGMLSSSLTGAMATGQREWVYTNYDLLPSERDRVIGAVAESLGRNLDGGGDNFRVTKLTAGEGHGHGLSIAYEVIDNRQRKWRVEWDGVGRSYTPEGEVISSSVRGGHIELVTPKFKPQYQDIAAVYQSFSEHGVIPSHKAGGGHINIDLAPFKGNPRALARFLSLFHQHRGIMALMFQNPGRISAAQPIEISDKLARELANFSGTETQLKQLLYNEGYFNKRVGRKTRNVQVDLSPFFQDVIPAKLISGDYDMKNPKVPWRRQFRVEPHIRKMEMRMFDAAVNPIEAASQIRLVRALLHEALSGTSQLTGSVQSVDYEQFARDTTGEKSMRKLKAMCRQLGLPVEQYKGFVYQGIRQSSMAVNSKHYVRYSRKMSQRHWVEVEGWGRALKGKRPSSRALSSESRTWSGEACAEAVTLMRSRVESATLALPEREKFDRERDSSKGYSRKLGLAISCKEVFAF